MTSPSLPTADNTRAHDIETRVHGSWLILLRGMWILGVALSLAVSIADIPLEFRRLH